MEDLQTLSNKKLYHQLTEAVISKLVDEKFRSQLPQVYLTYIKPVEQHLHPLKLAKLATLTAQLKTVPDALVFLNELLVKFTPTEDDYKKWTCLKIQAYIYLKLEVIHYTCVKQDYASADVLLKSVESDMLKVTSLETIVNAQYYKVKSDWYQLKGEFELYYSTSFEYLKYSTNTTKEELKRRGMDMSIAALLGNIYRFGDLIQHPVFTGVDEWLHQLVVAAQQGQLTVFEQLKPQILQNPTLQVHLDALTRKFYLMTVLAILFKINQKKITFSQLQQHARVPDLEIQLMRLMAQGLLQGKLDQVEQVVYVDKIYPQVLNKEDVGVFIGKLKEWQKQISVVEIEP